jgi:hypothetical protein
MQGLGAGSHVPWLGLLASRTTGPVIEFGIGGFSTILLHAMVAMQGRKLVSLETDPDWLANYKPLESENHHLGIVHNWVTFDIGNYWDVAFVDCSPASEEKQDVSPRVDIVKRLKGKAKFIACHDTEADIPPSAGAYGWVKLDGLFKYQTILDKFRPWTTVYSDVEEFKA